MFEFDERHVADHMGLSMANPLYWPVKLLRRLLALRKRRGHDVFLREIYQMMSPRP